MKYLSILMFVALGACAAVDTTNPGLDAEESAFVAFERLPELEAVEVYKGLSELEQKALWREQLERELARAETRDEEARFLAHVLENFDAIWSDPDAFEESLVEEFGGLVVSEYVTSLGSMQEGSLNATPTFDHLGNITGFAFGGNQCNTTRSYCGCNVSSGGPVMPPVTSYIECSHNCGDTESGCGIFGWQGCFARIISRSNNCPPQFTDL